MNLNTFLLIDGSLMLIGLPLLMILKGNKKIKIIKISYILSIFQIQLLILYPYKEVPQTVHIY